MAYRGQTLRDALDSTLTTQEKQLIECAWCWYCGWQEEAYELMTELIKEVVPDG